MVAWREKHKNVHFLLYLHKSQFEHYFKGLSVLICIIQFDSHTYSNCCCLHEEKLILSYFVALSS
jgi:hypothetical protein